MTDEFITCECGNKNFDMKHRLIRISAIQSGTGKEELADVPVFICDKCEKELLMEEVLGNSGLII